MSPPVPSGLTWLGHSCVEIRLDNVLLVTDPVLRARIFHLRRKSSVDPGILDGVDSCRAAIPNFTPRPVADIQALLTGLELVPPGLVPLVTWWPEGPLVDLPPDHETFYGAVARKP